MGRSLLVTACFAAIGVAMVVLRHHMAIHSHDVMKLHARITDLDRDIWTREMELARLREPAHVRDRVDQLQLPLIPPRADARGASPREARGHGPIRSRD
jgi:hypothetical protein